MKLFRDHLLVNEVRNDSGEELRNIRHSTCRVTIKIDKEVGFQRSKIATKLKHEQQGDLSQNLNKYISKKVIFTSFAPSVFEDFRISLGISNNAYISVRF